MSVSTILQANVGCIEFLLTAPSNLTQPNRNWHSAFAKIYCSRAFLSLSKTKYTSNKVFRSPSSTVVNLPLDNNDQHFKIDPTCLTELVQKKNPEKLYEFDGIYGIASALKTDIDGGICSTAEDIARRHEAFGSNTYKRPPSKSFFQFVVEAFKDLTILILLGCAVLSLAFGIKEPKSPSLHWKFSRKCSKVKVEISAIGSLLPSTISIFPSILKRQRTTYSF